MEDADREKIISNLSTLVMRTEWSAKLESTLVQCEVLKPKFLQNIKVCLFFKSVIYQSVKYFPVRIREEVQTVTSG